jgi:ribosomal protein L3 glutamine methyltransferase
MTDPLLPVLQTVRDWLRFAVSRFEHAGLRYGHGTATALDEAAFLILTALHLPPDALDPWLDARLTMAERKTLSDLVEARVVTRKPAAYLVKTAWIGPYRFHVDDRVIVPRSFIGELLIAGLDAVLSAGRPPRRILDLCTGSGCLAIVAAHTFADAQVDAADLSVEALAVARRNIAAHGLGSRVSPRQGDLFGAVGAQRYDLILCNPPYVRSAAVAAFPPEHKAEPAMAHDGGADGLTLIKRVMAEAASHLEADGVMVMEVGAEREAVERAWPRLPLLWLDTETSEGEVLAVTAAALGARKPVPVTSRARAGRPTAK